jgi:hypothetical protein
MDRPGDKKLGRSTFYKEHSGEVGVRPKTGREPSRLENRLCAILGNPFFMIILITASPLILGSLAHRLW